MTERWVGVVVSGDKVTLFDAEVPADGPIVVQADHTLPLQTGDKPAAYRVISQQLGGYLRENGVTKVIAKASALPTGSVKLAHLEAAELRGVVLAAAAAVCDVATLTKARISRTFGDRKVDEYVADNAFWKANVVGGNLRIGSREAAMLVLAARKVK